VDTKYDPVFIGLRIGRRKDRQVVGPAGGSGPSPIKRPGGPPTYQPAPAATTAVAMAAPRAAHVSEKVTSTASAAVSTASVAAKSKTALPAAGAAAGIGFLAWAIRRARKK
jgi:hypothetical protein